ncbi:MAG: peptidylprolyl isomerase [Treponema sp.]|jgi:hypothetical protein|nr:peptidylprolyl isomerase [Treponema sp.]
MASKTKRPPQTEDTGFSEIAGRLKSHPFLFGGTIVILVIVIVAFVFVPAIPNVGGGQDRDLIFGYYDGTPIAYVRGNYFADVLNELAAERQFELRGDYNANYAAAYDVWYGAFTRTLARVVILDEMNKALYSAPPREIDRQVAERPEFQEDGRFSVVKYRSYDRNKRLALWNKQRETHTTRKYIEDLLGLKISAAEKAFIAGMASPERSLELVFFPRAAYPDSELTAFAAANPGPFKNVHFSRITLASEKEAGQLLESVRSGRSAFEDAARNQSTDAYKDKGGDMGIRAAFETYTEISEEADRDKVIPLKKGELSPVIQVPGGWAFFRAEETPYSPDLSQRDALDKVRTYMDRFEGGRIENWLAARAEELSRRAGEKGLSLAAYIQSLPEDDPAAGFSVVNAGPVSLNYGNTGLFRTLDTAGNPGLGQAVSSEIFWRTAFATPLHTPSAPFTLGDAIVILTAVEETTPDETARNNTIDYYGLSWMYTSLDQDINAAFMDSAKFENNFTSVFFSLILQDQR